VKILDNLNIRSKLVGSFVLVSLLVLAVALLGYSNLNTLNRGVQEMYQARVLPVADLNKANAASLKAVTDVGRYLLLPDQRSDIEAEIQENISTFDTELSAYRDKSLSDAEKEALADVDNAWETYQEQIAEVLDKVKSGQESTAAEMLAVGGSAVEASDALAAALDKLVAVNAELAAQLHEQGDAAFTGATRTMFGFGVAGLIFAIACGWIISQSLTKPVHLLARSAEGLAVGSLNQDIALAEKMAVINRKDELGDLAKSFNQVEEYFTQTAEAVDRLAQGDLTINVEARSEQDVISIALSNMVANFRQSIGTIFQGTNSVADAAAQLSEAADNSGEATGQVARTIEEVAKGAVQSSEAVNEANRGVEELGRAIDGVAQSSQEIASAVEVLSTVANTVNEGSQDIDERARAALEQANLGLDTSREGLAAVQQTVASMEEIQRVVQEATQRMQEMGERSQQVGEIVATIEDIAGQTNLLALNAQGYRRPDQSSRPQRPDRSGTRRRAGPRLRGGCRRSAQARGTLRQSHPGDRPAHRRRPGRILRGHRGHRQGRRTGGRRCRVGPEGSDSHRATGTSIRINRRQCHHHE